MEPAWYLCDAVKPVFMLKNGRKILSRKALLLTGVLLTCAWSLNLHADENVSSQGLNNPPPDDRGGAPAGSIGFYSATYLYAPGLEKIRTSFR